MDAVSTSRTSYCSECGRPWPTEELARFGDRLICSECKNVYAQKLREGVEPGVRMEYAGFWIRFVAVIIDSIILTVVQSCILLLLRPSFSAPEMMLAASGLYILISLVASAAYEGFLIGQYGATPGKMALGLKVVRADGSPVSIGLAFGRYFAKMLSGFILLIGYIMAAFDAQKRALHDMICDTRVIRAPR